MNKGKIVETGDGHDVFHHPRIDYTRQTRWSHSRQEKILRIYGLAGGIEIRKWVTSGQGKDRKGGHDPPGSGVENGDKRHRGPLADFNR